MTSRRILFLSPSNKLFGARRSLLTTVTNLPAPWEPHVVCPGEGGLQAELARLGIAHHVVRHYNWRKGKFLIHRHWEIRRLRRLFESLQPAIVVANEYHSTPYAIRMVGESGAPVIACSRLTIPERHIRLYDLHRATLILCVSAATAADFNAQPWFAQKVRVLHNAVDVAALDLPEHDRAAARRAFRAEFGLGDGEFLIGMAGLISERKRQETAIRALKILNEEIRKENPEAPPAHLAIVGRPRPEDEPYERRMRSLAAELGVAPRVHWAGFRDDMRRVYPAFDANLLLSDEEGFGRVIIEAAVFAVPSIGTRIGGIPEIIRDGEITSPAIFDSSAFAESGAAMESPADSAPSEIRNPKSEIPPDVSSASPAPTGALIPLDDPPALAATLSFWMRDPARRARLAAAAAHQARTEFSIPRHMQRLTAILDEAMDKYEHCW